MVTPPALPSRRSTMLVASMVRLSLALRVPEKEYLPSLRTRTHTGSSAVNSTRTGALGWDASAPAMGTADGGAALGRDVDALVTGTAGGGAALGWDAGALATETAGGAVTGGAGCSVEGAGAGDLAGG
jgi:hypothetical protein